MWITVYTLKIRIPEFLIILVLKFEVTPFSACWLRGKCVDPDQRPFSAASELDLHYLLKPVCMDTCTITKTRLFKYIEKFTSKN